MDKKGFTLIELLIVIAIIGVLASVVLVRMSDARKKARDAERKSDLAQIKKGLEIYYVTYGQYPAENWCDSSAGTCATVCPCSAGSDWDYTTSIGAGLRSVLGIQNIPKDSINDTSYYYAYEPDCNQAGRINCTGKGCCAFSLDARLEIGGTFTLYGGG